MRSPDKGDGWRKVSLTAYPLVERFPHQDLIERDDENLRVRLTEKGKTVVEYVE